jgi:hypothetical protein
VVVIEIGAEIEEALEIALEEEILANAVASEPLGDGGKKRKAGKTKVIRDSFSFPESDYVKISQLKKSCLAAGAHVKKGEILRAGLHLLSKLSLTELTQVVEQVEKVKTGRPTAKY